MVKDQRIDNRGMNGLHILKALRGPRFPSGVSLGGSIQVENVIQIIYIITGVLELGQLGPLPTHRLPFKK